jgi:hypothetical protein
MVWRQMNDELEWIWKRLWVNRDTIQALARIESRKPSVRVTKFPTEIQTEYLQHAGLGHYRYDNLLGK